MLEVMSTVRIGLVIVMAWAAIAKALHSRDSSRSLSLLLRTSEHSARVVLGAIVIAEFVCAAALLITPTAGAVLATILFTLFASATALAFAGGSRGNCACFGSPDNERFSAVTPIRAVVLAVAAAVLIFTGPDDLEPTNWLLAFANGVGIAVIVRLLPDLGEAFGALRRPAPATPPTRRRSFRYVPANEPLFGGFARPISRTPLVPKDAADRIN